MTPAGSIYAYIRIVRSNALPSQVRGQARCASSFKALQLPVSKPSLSPLGLIRLLAAASRQICGRDFVPCHVE